MRQPPDVVHVGFSKCASTFLRSFFNDHPQAYLVSEAHFFVPFERSNYARGRAHYTELFRNAAPGQLKVESDEHIVLPLLHPVLRAAATTIEAVSQASERVRRTVGSDTKIILVIRNQADLILSRYGEYIMSGRDITFDAFVDEFLSSGHQHTNYYQNYYSKIIHIFRKDFAPSNVLVLLQEELYKNEGRVIEELCAFLGIEVPLREIVKPNILARFFSLDRFRVVARSGKHSKNTGLSFAGIKFMRCWNRLVVSDPAEAYYKKAVTKTPYAVYQFGVRAIRVIDYYLPKQIKGNKKALLTPAILQKIHSEFDEDNKKLAVLLSKDLKAFGYF